MLNTLLPRATISERSGHVPESVSRRILLNHAEENPVMTTSLVTASWLETHLDDPTVRILEISSSDDDATYKQGHIPGALWWYWKDLCWHATDREFLTPEAMAERLGRIAIAGDTTLVLYGDPVQFGTYAFWALTMSGHPDLRVLDGTRTKWMAEGRPLSQEIPGFEPVAYQGRAGEATMRVGREEVRAKLGQPGRLLLDVRSPEEYHGERVSPPPHFDHGAERKGRIPGAVHLFYRHFLNPDDTYKSPEELRALLRAVGATPEQTGEIVTYCRLSHRATLAWFAMRYILGYENVKIYDGSWTEWGSIVGFPIEK
jgi:thiosulfate/3-mercaptopyruvate sulfurtransferase